MAASKESRRLMWVTLSFTAIIVLLLAGLAWTLNENRNQANLIQLFQMAEKGDPDAEYKLGIMYRFGHKPFAIDYGRARAFFSKAAKEGHAPSQYELGRIYLSGLGTPKNPQSAIEWLGKAAAQNHPAANTALGFSYLFGKDVPANPALGKKLVIRGAELGDPWAFEILALYGHRTDYPHMSSDERIELYKWCLLGKRAGARTAFLPLGVKDFMTKNEIAAAEEQASKWPSSH
jgi:TPR repeat protein